MAAIMASIDGRRTPVEALLIAGGQRLFPAVLDHIKIKRDAALVVLHGVDHADLRIYSSAGEIARKGKRETLFVFACHHDLEAERLVSVALAQHGAVELIACRGEQRECLAQRVPVAA